MTNVLITRLVVHPEQVDRALRVFRDMQADVRTSEPGTISYQYYRQVDDPTVFWVHEVFANTAAKEAHLGRHGQRRPDFDLILAEPPAFHDVEAI